MKKDLGTEVLTNNDSLNRYLVELLDVFYSS